MRQAYSWRSYACTAEIHRRAYAVRLSRLRRKALLTTFGVQDMEHIQRHVRQGAFKRIEYHRLVALRDRPVRFCIGWLHMDISIPGGLYPLLQWVLYRFYLFHSSHFCYVNSLFSRRIMVRNVYKNGVSRSTITRQIKWWWCSVFLGLSARPIFPSRQETGEASTDQKSLSHQYQWPAPSQVCLLISLLAIQHMRRLNRQHRPRSTGYVRRAYCCLPLMLLRVTLILIA